MSEQARTQWLIQSLFLYLMLYVTAQVFLNRMPTLLGHIVTWGIIAVLYAAIEIASHVAKSKKERR